MSETRGMTEMKLAKQAKQKKNKIIETSETIIGS